MTAYDGKVITHDSIGNPLTDGIWTYTWEHGRELASMSGGGTTWTYTYDANGMRTKRTNGTTTYEYVYNGSSLSYMSVADNTLYFSYGADGKPVCVLYNGLKYFYVTNLQGDVTAILDRTGNAVVTYTYDAWGNILSMTGSSAMTLGKLNPLRYRGYVYDQETELYYLQSRYYDPQIGRFINADAIVSTGQGLLGNNMYAYCGNNPANCKDTSGHSVETAWDLFSVWLSLCDVIENPDDLANWLGLGLDLVDLIPLLSGCGEAYRAYRTADRILEGFGNLSKAKEYGIMGYNALRKLLSGTGLEAHHIVEKRLVQHLGIDINNMLSVAVTKSEHQVFTNAWRSIFPYGMDYTDVTIDMLWDAAQIIYKDYPDLLDAAKTILYG